MFGWFRKAPNAKSYTERDPRIVVAVITSDDVEPACMASIVSQDYPDFSILVHRMTPKIMSLDSRKSGIKNMIRNRQTVRRMLLATDSDAFLMVDSDIVLPPSAISNLSQHRLDFLCGWYRSKGIGGLWTAANITRNELIPYDEPHHSVIRVSSAGLGCALVSRRLLEQVDFRDGTDQHVRHKDHILFIDDSTQFCLDAAAKGFPPCMDGDTICEHLTRQTETSYSAGV